MEAAPPDFGKLAALRAWCLAEAGARELQQAAGRLRRLRAAAGYSRAQWARALKVEPAVLLALENGYGDAGTARAVLAGAEALAKALARP